MTSEKRVVLEVVGLERNLGYTRVKLGKPWHSIGEIAQEFSLTVANDKNDYHLGDQVEVTFKSVTKE